MQTFTQMPMVAALFRNGKILRASAVARVDLNHQTVTRHIILVFLKALTSSTRSRLNFRKNY